MTEEQASLLNNTNTGDQIYDQCFHKSPLQDIYMY